MKACPSYPKLFQTRALSGGGKKIKKSVQNVNLVWIVLLAEKKKGHVLNLTTVYHKISELIG